MRYNVDAMMAK